MVPWYARPSLPPRQPPGSTADEVEANGASAAAAAANGSSGGAAAANGRGGSFTLARSSSSTAESKHTTPRP